MALQHLRSSTAHKRPIPTVMSAGQIAINTNEASPALFFKDSNGDLVKVGPVHIGTDAPNSSPASVAATALVTGTVYQILTVGDSDFTLVGASANTVGTIFTATGTTTGTGTVSGQQGVEKGEQWLDTTGGTYVLKIYDGTDWRSESGTFVDVSGDTMTGDLVMNNANIVFEGATADDFETTLTVTDPTADRSIVLPDVSGDLVTTGDTGTVTSTMIADGTIVNADINASAAIAGTKIDPDFGSQTIETTGVFSAADGAAATPSITFTGDTNTGIYRPGADQVAISTNGTGRLFVDSSGNVGIGGAATSTASTTTLQVTDGTTARMLLESTGAGGRKYGWYASTDGQFAVYDYTASSERMRIDSSGRLGIGTSSPSRKLQVSGDFGAITTDTTTPGFFQHIDGTTTLGNSFSTIHRVGNDGNNRYSLSAWQVQNDNGLTQRAFIGSRAVAGAANYNPLMVFGTTTGNGTYDTRMVIDGLGNVGIGTTSPGAELHVNPGSGNAGNVRIDYGTGSSADGYLNIEVNSGGLIYETVKTGGMPHIWYNTGAERMRIDTAGRLLVGTSSWSSDRSLFVVEGNQIDGTSFGRMAVARGAADVGNNTQIGDIVFADSSQSVGASIAAFGEGTWATNDYPSRLVFSTTADGASSPTERMRITSGGLTQCTFISSENYVIVGTEQGGTTVNAAIDRQTNGNGTNAVYIGTSQIQVTSDIRLKHNIANTELNATEKIKQIEIFDFDWNDPRDNEWKNCRGRWTGFSAQQVQPILPFCINAPRDEETREILEDDPSDWVVDPTGFIPVLVKALQEANVKIETLEQRLSDAGIA